MKLIIISCLTALTAALKLSSFPTVKHSWSTHYFWVKCSYGQLSAFRNVQLRYIGTGYEREQYCDGYGRRCIVVYNDEQITFTQGQIKLKTFGMALPYILTVEERGLDCNDASGPVEIK